MSGGYFDYDQHRIMTMIEDVSKLIENNNTSNYPYSHRTIVEFKLAKSLLERCYVYLNRIDYLVSGDDSEKTFHECLSVELVNINKNQLVK
jgi:hypothetical protein